MKIITSTLFALLLCVCTTPIAAQIINEKFDAAPWTTAKPTTAITEITTDAGVWKVYNTEINIEQASANVGSIGALIFPKNTATPNLETRPYVEIPVVEKGGVASIDLIARYGTKVTVYSQLEVQKFIDGAWVKIGETSIDESNSNKPTKYSIVVDDLSDNIKLRIYYNGENASSTVRVHDVLVYAPSLGSVETLTANNVTDNGFELQWDPAMLAESYEIVVSTRNAIENAELVVDGDAETNLDGAWTLLNSAVSSDKVFQGNNAFSLIPTTGYAGILQKIAVEPGTTITISAKGFVAENTTGSGDPIEYTAEMRLWGQFLDAQSQNVGNVRVSGLPELKAPSTDWIDFSLNNVLVPEGAAILDLDFRAQVGVKAYFDNISVIGTKVEREAISATPITTNQNSCSVSGLMADQEYSVYVYSVKGEEKSISKELVVKTSKGTGINVSNQNDAKVYIDNGMLRLENIEQGANICIVNSLGQVIYNFVANNTSFETELSKGFYLVKVGNIVHKVMNNK